MPRHTEAMKDVVSCDKLRRGANNLRSADFRMGKPGRGHARSSYDEYIVVKKPTGRTETSKYPQEKKTTVIPIVAASELGTA